MLTIRTRGKLTVNTLLGDKVSAIPSRIVAARREALRLQVVPGRIIIELEARKAFEVGIQVELDSISFIRQVQVRIRIRQRGIGCTSHGYKTKDDITMVSVNRVSSLTNTLILSGGDISVQILIPLTRGCDGGNLGSSSVGFILQLLSRLLTLVHHTFSIFDIGTGGRLDVDVIDIRVGHSTFLRKRIDRWSHHSKLRFHTNSP